MASHSSNRLVLEDLIDLEVQLAQDQEKETEWLHERDAVIGRKIRASELSGNSLFLSWLRQLRSDPPQPGSSAGQQLKQWLALLGLTLCIIGGLMGFGAVAAWLRIDPQEPVNALLFWIVLIGVQILFLFGWCIAILPRKWLKKIPLVSGLQLLLRMITKLIPLVAGWLAVKLSHEHRQWLATVRAAATRFDKLYGPIRFWSLIQLSQIFALAYNVGAIVALVLLTHGNDPAFCWKSTMLENEHVLTAARIASAPWSAVAPAATLSDGDIEATRYWSYEQDYIQGSADAGNKDAWKKWSSFLLASLLVYGLLPRLLTLTFSAWRVRREVATVKLGHVGFERLRERLCRPFVVTRSPERDAYDDGEHGASILPESEYQSSQGPASAVKSMGVPLTDDELIESIRVRFGKSIETVHHALGQIDDDESMLTSLVNGQAPDEVFVVVEAWEPPVNEYLDLLTQLRSKLGDRRMINVVLYNRAPDGQTIEPKARHLEMWQRKLAAVGDPWLRLEPLGEGRPA
jgi:hypothetical protein